MKLNKAEFCLVDNPFRAFLQSQYEAPVLRSLSSITNIDRALEIGCGNGYGTTIIRKLFHPRSIDAIDLDEKMIDLAQRRHQDKDTNFRVMDACRLDWPDNQFDAAFEFNSIHHIANWKDCLRELKRVLKPGGELILEELPRDTFESGLGKIWYRSFSHPTPEMFTAKEFTAYISDLGLVIEQYKEANPLGLLKHFFLVARKLA